tara:strand:+ start:199 stop:819 length:621 start_codon:yes stop_codon:yes gene_type:complete
MARTARRSDGLNLNYKSTVGSNKLTERHIMWAASDWNDLTVSTKSDANVDTGFTMADGYIYEGAWIGGDNAASMVIGAATVGALTVFRFTGQADGDAAITFTTTSGDFFAAQTLDTVVTNVGDLHSNGPVLGHAFTSTVAVNGGAIKTSAATHNTLIIEADPTNNQTHLGAELAFFCQETGFWRWSFKGSELGSGALNTTFATSAV